MADRSVTIRLRAEVADLKRQLAEAKAAVKGVGDQSEQTSKQSTTAMTRLAGHARENERAYNMVGGALLALGTAAAVGVGVAVAKFADFDEGMSAVAAATHETTENMGLLRAAAIKAGADTQFSATEAASAIEEMAKAGIQTADILGGGLSGALDLAAAGSLGVAEAAEVAATALTIFKLEGRDLPHVADLLAAGAGKAQGSVSDMGMALKQAGLVANQTGLSIEETTGGLAAFASAGLVGSDAGTSFKSMLQRLTPQSLQAKNMMDDLGISAYDAGGNFIGLDKFAGNLRESMKDLTPEARNAAMSVIFGSDAVRASSVLYDQGEAGIRKWIDSVDDSGFAAETARLKTDNLRGDVERLGGSFDTALIQTGSVANEVLRGMTQRVGSLVDAYGAAPPIVQGATLAVGGATAAVGLAGGAALIAVPKMVEFYDSLGKMGSAGVKAQGALKGVGGIIAGPWGLALGAGVLALGLWAEAQFKAAQRVDALSSTLDQQTGAITDNTRAETANQLQKRGALDAAKALGLSLETVTDAALGNASATREVDAALRAVGESAKGAGHNPFTGESGSSSVNDAKKLREQLEGYGIDLDKAQQKVLDVAAAKGKDAEASDDAAASQDALVESLSAGTSAASDASDAIDDLSQALSDLNDVGQNAIDAQMGWEAAIDAATEALDKNGKTLDISEEAGRKNMAALQEMAASAESMADTILKETGSEQLFRDSLTKSRDALYQTARDFGMTEEEAHAYVDRVLSIPTVAPTSIKLTGAQQAIDDLNRVAAGIMALPRERITSVHINEIVSRGGNTGGGFANGAVLDFYADGGMAESHVAQIAPAGAMRLWAEPETGGEAYIPLAPSKRDRSLRIWEETGDRLGVNYVRFGEGGFSGSGGSPAGSRGDSLSGLAIEGTLDLGNGLVGMMRGVVRGELHEQAHNLAGRR